MCGAYPDITMASNHIPAFLEDGDMAMADLGYLNTTSVVFEIFFNKAAIHKF